MMSDQEFSSAFQDIYNEALFASYRQGLEGGLAKMDAAFEEGRTETLSQAEQDYLGSFRLVWRQAVDPNYTPPAHYSSEDTYPLSLKSKMYLKKRKFLAGLLFEWQHLTYMPAGTSKFSTSLIDLLHVAQQVGDIRMARCVAELFLSHYDLSKMVTATWEKFQDNIEQLTLKPLPEIPAQNWDMPWVEALKGIEEDPSDCWARILRTTLEQAPEEARSKPYYEEIVAALQTFYEDTGNLSELEFLQAYR